MINLDKNRKKLSYRKKKKDILNNPPERVTISKGSSASKISKKSDSLEKEKDRMLFLRKYYGA